MNDREHAEQILEVARRDLRSVFGNLVSSKAVDEMVVDEADGLHPGVDDGGADELEAAALQIL